jgi:hypothetical protein
VQERARACRRAAGEAPALPSLWAEMVSCS